MPKGKCCKKCWSVYPFDGVSMKAACLNPSCECHVSQEKMESIGIGDPLPIPPLREEEGSILDILKGKATRLPDFEEPAPLVGEWEKEFDTRFSIPWLKETGYNLNKLKEFIRSLLDREYKEGYYNGKKTNALVKPIVEDAFKAGKAEVVRELRGKLPDQVWNKDPSNEIDRAYLDGFVDYRKQVLSLLDSLSEETPER